MAKINQKITRLVSGAINLFVIHRTGKNGISVFVRIRKPGQQATIGARNVFLPANTAQAEKKYQERIAEAQKLGYTEKVVSGGPAATKFDTIPAPNAVPDGLPLKGKTTKPAAVKSGPKPVTRAVAR